MTKIIMHGCNGHMGKVVSDIVARDPETEIVAGIDIAANDSLGYPVYTNPADCQVEADCVVDFSTAKAVDALLDYCVGRKLPLVLCTTGLSEEQLSKVEEASAQIAILRSANMSLGVNTLFDLVQKAASVFAPAGFDIEIVEQHHNRKLDAPSGTAVQIADAINEALEEKYEYTYNRSDKREKRPKLQIGISSVRGGSIVGIHEVIFAGEDEVVEIKHTAYSRAIFGKGAVEAAKFIKGRDAGKYDMREVVKK